MISGKENFKSFRRICYMVDLFTLVLLFASIVFYIKQINSIETVTLFNILTIIQLTIFNLYINQYRKNSNISYSILRWKCKSNDEKHILYQELTINALSGCIFIFNTLLYVQKNRIILGILFLLICLLKIYTRVDRKYQKIYEKNVLYWVSIMAILGFVIVSAIWNFNVRKELFKDEKYTFNNTLNYDLCKKLYEDSSKLNYIILSSSDTVLELREISNSFTEIRYFDTKEKCDEFISSQTMGRGVYIPVLSGKCSFNRNELSVKYEPTITRNTKIQIQKKYGATYLMYFGIYIVLLLIVESIYEFKIDKGSK